MDDVESRRQYFRTLVPSLLNPWDLARIWAHDAKQGSEAQRCPMGFQSFGFRAQGFGFKVQGLEFRVQGLGFRVSGPGLRYARPPSPTMET